MLTRQQKKANKISNNQNKTNDTSISSQEGIVVEILDQLEQHPQKQQINEIFHLDPQQKRIQDYSLNYKQENFQELVEAQFDITLCLSNHKIREWVRGKMIDWMIEVFANQENDICFFRAVHLLDAFLKRSYNYTDSDIYLIGVTCIFIASKIEDVYHMSIRSVSEILSHNKYTIFQIKECESIILETLCYETNFPTINDFIQYFLYELFQLENSQIISIIKETCIYVLKMCYHDYGIMQYNQLLLATSIIGFVIKSYNQSGGDIKIDYSKLIGLCQLEVPEFCECIQNLEILIQNFHKKYPQYENLKQFA